MRTLNPTQEEHFAVRCAENRLILFGAFNLSTNVTKLNRRNKWEEIARELMAMGAPIKTATHLRDVSFYNSLSRSVISKLKGESEYRTF